MNVWYNAGGKRYFPPILCFWSQKGNRWTEQENSCIISAKAQRQNKTKGSGKVLKREAADSQKAEQGGSMKMEYDRSYPVRLEIEEAVELLLQKAGKVSEEQVSLGEVDGRILAEDIFARENIPPFDRSPLDGYAFRAEDVASANREHPVVLKIIEELPAGTAPSRTVGKGEAVKLSTGAPIPPGADCVEKFERTEFTDEQVKLFASMKSGSNICRAGEDIRQGDKVMEAGTELSAAQVGLLAGLGCAEVRCFARLRAAVISTGSELLPEGSELTPGKIRSTNGHTIRSLSRKWGMETKIYGIVPDDQESIARAVADCAEQADVIITTGGVSVGDYDLVEAALRQLGAELLFWKLGMKPGMAALAAIYQGKLVLGLSGNPSAALATLCMVGHPVLNYMGGRREYYLKQCQVRMLRDFPKKSPQRRFLPGKLVLQDGEVWFDFGSRQSNGMLNQWAGCDVIAEIPAGSGSMKKGSLISAYY